MPKPPLILTMALDHNSFVFFNSLRQKHFPKARNFIDAHLTLFHALPNEQKICERVYELSEKTNSFKIRVHEPVSIVKGVAFKLESNEILQLHRQLQNEWNNVLTPQDKQKLWPHVTIQNKVSFDEVQKLLQELKLTFKPFEATAIGLQLWEYLNGPWNLVQESFFENKNEGVEN